MPNHVTTILRIPPEVADAITTVEEGERRVDFALLVPPPQEGYNDDPIGCSHSHPLHYDPNDPNANCWYSWNREFWGTKWNAYDTRVEGGDGDVAVVTFETAWSHPAPVIEALARRFPDIRIEVAYADEDLGSNVGSYVIEDGQVVDENFPANGSDEANEMAALIKYGRSYAGLRAEWEAEDEEFQRQYARHQEIKAERGVDDTVAWQLLADEEKQQRAKEIEQMSEEI